MQREQSSPFGTALRKPIGNRVSQEFKDDVTRIQAFIKTLVVVGDRSFDDNLIKILKQSLTTENRLKVKSNC